MPVTLMFTDRDYQRDLTSFVDKIEAGFNPALVGTLALSLRGSGKYAIIDGQTRMVASERLGFEALPALVFTGLTKPQEAEIFYLLQTERRTVQAWEKFKAKLVAKNKEALAIRALVRSVGLEVGGDKKKGEISATAALEKAYKRDDFVLERSLVTLRAAWPDRVPDRTMILGVFAFYVLAEKLDVDDERLVRRLQTIGVEELKIRAAHKRRGSAGGGNSQGFFAAAIMDAYRKG